MLLRDETNSISARVYIARSRKLRIAGTGALCSLVLLSILAAFPISNNNDNAEATYVPATTTLSIVSSKDTASVDITPTSASGTFATSAAADQAEFTVTTDNLTGYSLNILGTDTSGQLVNTATGDTLDTISADATESDFRTGASATYDNKWGYRLTVNGTTGANFLAAPTTSSKTIYTTSAPNTTADNYTLGVGARVDYSKPVGTYTNTFVLTAVANSISYQINYLDADGTTQLLPSDAESNISASSIELNSTAPTKSGYNFLGWCDGTLSADGESCTGTPGTTYDPGDTYTFSSFSSTGTTIANLYAMWERGLEIQNLPPSECTTTPTTVVDNRDGQVYTVQRLADGKCWMMTNLNLGATAITEDLTSANTNLATTISASDFNSWQEPSGSGIYSSPEYSVSASGTDSTSQTPYGTYYNYCVASAKTICANSNSSNASHDICPAGWRLPTGGSSGEFQTLYNQSAYNTSAKMRAPYTSGGAAFALAGSFGVNTAPMGKGSGGYYWSSTRRDNTGMYYMFLGTDSVSPASYSNRYFGFSIRCVLKQTMQSFSTKAADVMATNSSLTLEDERDGQLYTVKKLGNGNVWMTRNLAIGCNGSGSTYGSNTKSVTLKNTDTNMSAATWSSPTTLLTAGNSDSTPEIQCSNKLGAWYNFRAASAGTISDVVTNSKDDICPLGWHLPEVSELNLVLDYGGDFIGTIESGEGYYRDKKLTTYRPIWWTSYVGLSSASNQFRINLYTPSDTTLSRGTSQSYDGQHIRCVKDSGLEMQNITYADLNQYIPNAGDSITLKDNRDGQRYKVAKLADGNIWMTENLSLDISDSAVQANLNSTTTNADNTTLNYLKDGGGSSPYPAYGALKNSWSDDYTTPRIIDWYKDSVQAASGSAPAGKIGIYYNYCAASAGSYCYGENASSGNASQDICPSGWRMPTGGASGEYQTLYTAYSSSVANFQTALSTPLAGYYAYGAVGNQGMTGNFWSSTRSSGNDMHLLNINTSSVDPQSNYNRYSGYSVRCILNDSNTLSTVTYMQDITPQVIAKASNGDTATLTDSRDGQEYSVAKINGKLWMTRNLAIGCDGTGSTYGSNISSKVLLPSGSNVASAWSTPTNSLTLGNDYTDPRMECSSTYGAWYNFAATSVGTITGSSTTTESVYSICPTGWHLPSSTEYSSILSYESEFNPTPAGDYYNGGLHSDGVSTLIWSSTAVSGSTRYSLAWDSTNHLRVIGTGNNTFGYSVRCVSN